MCPERHDLASVQAGMKLQALQGLVRLGVLGCDWKPLRGSPSRCRSRAGGFLMQGPPARVFAMAQRPHERVRVYTHLHNAARNYQGVSDPVQRCASGWPVWLSSLSTSRRKPLRGLPLRCGRHGSTDHPAYSSLSFLLPRSSFNASPDRDAPSRYDPLSSLSLYRTLTASLMMSNMRCSQCHSSR